jgi:hypothetical protein
MNDPQPRISILGSPLENIKKVLGTFVTSGYELLNRAAICDFDIRRAAYAPVINLSQIHVDLVHVGENS